VWGAGCGGLCGPGVRDQGSIGEGPGLWVWGGGLRLKDRAARCVTRKQVTATVGSYCAFRTLGGGYRVIGGELTHGGSGCELWTNGGGLTVVGCRI